MGRSFRVARRDYLVRRGERAFRVEGRVETAGVRHEIAVTGGKGLRQRHLDGKNADLAATLPVFSCLVFASSRLDLFRGSPVDRRRFLDRGVATAGPALISSYQEHTRALRQKNELLRRGREENAPGRYREQVLAFNALLAAAGSRIRQARSWYVDRLQATLDGDRCLAELVPGGAPQVFYRPSPRLDVLSSGEIGAIREALRAALDARIEDESRRGYALIGPQRDTLAICQQGVEMAVYGSSGQQRAALIALKMCKMLVHKQLTGSYPLLLVDDVDSELDAERTRRALAVLEGPFQALVASARGDEWARRRYQARLLLVQDGIITEVKSGATPAPPDTFTP